ncbi:hypothetical protein C7H85_04265 [Zobellella endophytica]|uniref:Uncharacterized protein n=1 Tax=Zobellella endophytica TaxID=2116700 RepID=A0A2P7RCX5_9GAMM|nr:hypothetical protein [Zobellella endophytica]PSJ48020.1 hypothetical protein C7H85_04265 [Zobellella endophytica]
MSRQNDIELVKQSGLFDEQWYLRQYPDVAKLEMCPAGHFIDYGWRLGRNPSSRFSTRLYLEHNDDVAKARVNPLLHYLRQGKKEKRTIMPVPANTPSSLSVPLPAAMPGQDTTPATPNEKAQLAQTQQLLEHYFNRCQQLEYQLLDR